MSIKCTCLVINSLIFLQDIVNDPAFQKAVKTSHGRRPPPTAARLGTAQRGLGNVPRGTVIPPSSMGARPITGANTDGANRPMTAVRAAGFTSMGGRGNDGLLGCK